jgi:hypothetical protein
MTTPAELLRAELRGLLSDIDDEIRTGFPASSSEMARRTCLAELSVVRDLSLLLRRALLGDEGGGGGVRRGAGDRFSTPGQAFDLRDSLAVLARSVLNERQRQEAELGTLQVAPWPSELRADFQRLIDAELRVCNEMTKLCGGAREHASALRTLVANLCDVCLEALARAAALSDAGARRALGEQANRAAEAAVVRWLDWRARFEAAAREAWRGAEPLAIPRALLDAAASDERAAAFLGAIRRTLKLRREQLRLLAAQQRLSAVLAAAEALSALQERIQTD